jgi:regulator of sigma E protease
MSLLLLILGLVLFVGLVVVHEFGHFVVARRNGVEVEEFGIFFPPRLWKKRVKSAKGDYDFTINLLPLGGFVKLKGEHDSDKAPGSFGAATLWAKVKIMMAGVTMNLLTAFFLLTLLALLGIPKLIDNQFTVARDTHEIRHQVLIGYVEPDSPAAKAGLESRDELVSIRAGIGEFRLASAKDLPELTKGLAGRQVDVTYARGSELKTVRVQLRSNEEVDTTKNSDSPKGYLGISPTEYILQRSTWSAPIVAAGLIKQITELTFKGLGSVFAGLFHGDTAKATAQVAGPVGIFVLLKDGSILGYQFVLMIIAIISLTLALINALPIPALDGGRLFVTMLFRFLRRPLRKSTEEWIHGSGFAALMLLFLLITWVDIRRFF